jgi:hypothetical protein
MTMTWKFAAASVRGTSHEQTGTPCQDACAIEPSANGKWVALVASDGAGTAAHSEVGSRLVVAEFSKALIAIASRIEHEDPGAWVTDAVIEAVLRLRNQLRKESGSDDISAYHCTLVAALIGESGGFAIHLGDGAVIGGPIAQPGINHAVVNLSQEYFLSEPKNGEYANETFFITERDWIKNLRIQPMPAVDWIVLGTDGGMALAMVGERLPKDGFVKPVLDALLSSPSYTSRNEALRVILADRQADRLTNDDKTLIAAVRGVCLNVVGEFQEKRLNSTEVDPTGIKIAAPSSFKKTQDQRSRKKNNSAGNIEKTSVFSGRKIHVFLFGMIVLLLISIFAIIYFKFISVKIEASRIDGKAFKLEETVKPVIPIVPAPALTASPPAVASSAAEFTPAAIASKPVVLIEKSPASASASSNDASAANASTRGLPLKLSSQKINN